MRRALGQGCVLLELTDEPVLLCAPYALEQKSPSVPETSGGPCLDSQTLWVTLKAACPHGIEPRCKDTWQLSQWTTSCARGTTLDVLCL